MTDTILDCKYSEARKILLSEKSYCSIDLPEYYTFQTLLDSIHNWDKKFEFSKVAGCKF